MAPTTASRATVAAAIEHTNGMHTWFSSTERLAATRDSGAFLVRGLGGDVANSGFKIGDGRMIAAPGEAIAGYGLLDRLGIAVGDELGVEINGRPLHVRLVGWYSETEDSGDILQVPLATLRTVDPKADAGQYLVRLDRGADTHRTAAALRTALGDRALVVENTPDASSELDTFRTAFLLVTLLVLIVAFANLASTMLLATRERFHDFGVLRSIGFTPRQVVAVMTGAAAAIGAFATIAGVPIGVMLLRALLDQIGSDTGVGPGFGVDPPALLLVVLVPLGAALAALLGALMTRRAAADPVSELVRFQ